MNENSSKAKFQFREFFINRSLIEQSEGEPSSDFSIGFDPKGFVNKKKSIFQLRLGIKINDKKNVINIEISSVANYHFDKEITKDQLDKLFYINAPAILFPYIRAYISTLTNLSGFKPINLPTLNLTGLGEDLKQNTKEIEEE
jgi:preprotein translocase subunit SecB